MNMITTLMLMLMLMLALACPWPLNTAIGHRPTVPQVHSVNNAL